MENSFMCRRRKILTRFEAFPMESFRIIWIIFDSYSPHEAAYSDSQFIKNIKLL